MAEREGEHRKAKSGRPAQQRCEGKCAHHQLAAERGRHASRRSMTAPCGCDYEIQEPPAKTTSSKGDGTADEKRGKLAETERTNGSTCEKSFGESLNRQGYDLQLAVCFRKYLYIALQGCPFRHYSHFFLSFFPPLFFVFFSLPFWFAQFWAQMSWVTPQRLGSPGSRWGWRLL